MLEMICSVHLVTCRRIMGSLLKRLWSRWAVVSVGCVRSACDRVMQVHQLDSCQCAADNSDNTPTGDMVDPTARFADAIGGAYEQVIHWRRNLFNVPYGAAGADFIDEVSALLRGFADGNRLCAIAWKALCVACHVLLQQPHASCSLAAFSQHLSHRLLLWRAGKGFRSPRGVNLYSDSLTRCNRTPADCLQL